MQRFDTELEFTRVERLSQVVVDPNVISSFLVHDGSFFCEHYYRRRYALFPKKLTQLHPVDTRHYNIQNNEVRRRRKAVVESFYPIRGLKHFVTFAAEIIRDRSA